MPTPHTTLLEILSRPVTGDASEIQDAQGKIIHPTLLDNKKKSLGTGLSIDDGTATPDDIKA